MMTIILICHILLEPILEQIIAEIHMLTSIYLISPSLILHSSAAY